MRFANAAAAAVTAAISGFSSANQLGIATSRSAASQIRTIARTAPTGSTPIAVSADNITASKPSRTAADTSETSARVGRDDWIIDSSISVAQILTVPLFSADNAMARCAEGTCS